MVEVDVFVRARNVLRECLPESLKNNTFQQFLDEDPTMKRMLQELNAVIQNYQQPPIIPGMKQ